jgi:predicted dehydrogenase
MEIRLGVVGCGYGKNVTIPAFRVDPRCRVIAIAAASLQSAQSAASELGIEHAYGDWRELIASPDVDAVAVAVPPHFQADIVQGALQARKPVFAEKPLAIHLAGAHRLAEHAGLAGVANMVDFNFTAVAAFAHARQMLQQNAIGNLRHVVVNWQTESYTNRARIENWKSTTSQGGGSLANFVSHCLHYLEWFAGPIAGLSARLFRLPNDSRSADTAVSLTMEFSSGAAGMLAMSAAAFSGSGHRIELYGEDGSLVLENSSQDYMRGFRLLHGRRPGADMTSIAIDDEEQDIWKDGRILPVSRLARQFCEWIEHGTPARPDFRDGLRVQELIVAAQSSHQEGRWVKT